MNINIIINFNVMLGWMRPPHLLPLPEQCGNNSSMLFSSPHATNVDGTALSNRRHTCANSSHSGIRHSYPGRPKAREYLVPTTSPAIALTIFINTLDESKGTSYINIYCIK